MTHVIKYIDPAAHSTEQIQDLLDQAALRGWELVSLAHIGATPNGPRHMAVFRKPGGGQHELA